MDDWDVMEFSEITALLKSEKDEIGLNQLFRDSDSHRELAARQNSESCSSLTAESRTSSPTSDQESIGVSEHWSQVPDGNFIKLDDSHSKLMSMSVTHPSSGNNTDETFVLSSQDPVVWNPTSTTTTSDSEALVDRNFVRLIDLKLSGLHPISTSPPKLRGETLIRFSEGSVMQKSTPYPPIAEADRALSEFQTPNITRLVQSSTLSGTALEANMARRDRARGSSHVSQLIKQQHILFPTSSSAASSSEHYAKLVDENQSVPQIPVFPSSKGKAQVYFDDHTCHTSDETIEQSNLKQVVVQNHAQHYTTPTGLGFPVANWRSCESGTSSKQAIKLTKVMDSSAKNSKTTKAQPQTSVKCRSRSKPGFSTNPRSLTEKTRRTRINERFKELQELVPKSVQGDNIVEMLDQAITYVGNLEKQLQMLLVKKGNQRVIDFISMSRVTDDETDLETTNSETAKRGKYC